MTAQPKEITLSSGSNKLPRGGFLVQTELGYIQYGAPPETIKDTMRLENSVPRIFILPDELFSIDKGIAVAELEFPLYFNHFIRQVDTLVICTEEQKNRLEIVLKEAVFGPETIDLSSEFKNGEKDPGYPDMSAEMEFFRGNRQLSDLIKFGVFEDNRYSIENVEIKRGDDGRIMIYEHGDLLANLPRTIEFNIVYDVGERLHDPFEPPEYGITCLGPSHGFDPDNNTSGFLLWINHRGIMIDPPVNSTEWLRQSNVNPKLISHIILTHCHEDHDAGTFQKILEENPVTIHTTETIMDSFLRKYTALTGLTKKSLLELFQFQPAMIDEPVYIEGGEFLFHYALHAIPTIGFRVIYRDQSFLYTSDHLNSPEQIKAMNEKGIFPKGRYDFLINFPWHYKVIYHEAGVPPIHTPISYLNSLPEDVQKRVTCYHIAEKDFPEDTHLTLARFGIENTLYPPVSPPRHAEAMQILDVMNHVDLFSDFKVAKVREFLIIINEEQFKQGETIIEKNTPGDKFYMIVNGNVSIQGTESGFSKTYGKYEYFGEASLVTGNLRGADIIAQTDCTLLTIEKNAFLNFIQGTSLDDTFKALSEIRDSNSWDVLTESKIFGSMTSYQKTQLESLMSFSDRKPDQPLLEEGKPSHYAFIIKSGRVRVTRAGTTLIELGAGDFVGDIFSLQKKIPGPFTATTIDHTELYEISVDNLTHFIQKNPGVYMRLMRAHEELITE